MGIFRPGYLGIFQSGHPAVYRGRQQAEHQRNSQSSGTAKEFVNPYFLKHFGHMQVFVHLVDGLFWDQASLYVGTEPTSEMALYHENSYQKKIARTTVLNSKNQQVRRDFFFFFSSCVFEWDMACSSNPRLLQISQYFCILPSSSLSVHIIQLIWLWQIPLAWPGHFYSQHHSQLFTEMWSWD